MDALQYYLREISLKKYDPITRQEELELARRIGAGDATAVKLIINANLRFVVGIARLSQSLRLPLADLIAAGNAALVSAAGDYREMEGCRFISYAVWRIRKIMLIEAADHSRTIRLPRWVAHKLLQQLRCLMSNHPLPGRTTNSLIKNFSRDSGIPGDIISRAIDADALQENRVGPEELARECMEPEELEQESFAAAVERSLCLIKDGRDREIIRRYFGLGRGVPFRIHEISSGMNVQKDRVRKSIRESLALLRKSGVMRALYRTECN
jgi:RNA polymerase primary sigma factor